VIAMGTTTLKKDFEETLTLAKKLKPLRDMRAQMQRERVSVFSVENVNKMILTGKDPQIERQNFEAKITDMQKQIDEIKSTVHARFNAWSGAVSEWVKVASQGVVLSRRLELKSLLERAAAIIVESENTTKEFAKRHEELSVAKWHLVRETDDHPDGFRIPELTALYEFPRVRRDDYESGSTSRTLLSIPHQIQ
jgi:hypothetical protein